MTEDQLDRIQFEIREQAAAAHPMTFTGIAVPWGQVITLADGSKESFTRGSIPEISPDSPLPLFWAHDHKSMPVGVITRGTDAEEGYVIECRISATPSGLEAYQLLKDGALKGLSIGFAPVTSRKQSGIEVRTSVLLKEVSLCNFPAYGTAQVTEVREEIQESTPIQEIAPLGVDTPKTDHSKKGPTMDEDTMTELRSEIADLGRQVALIGSPITNSGITLQTRSFGEAVKSLVTGGIDAETFNRDVDAVLADTATPDSTWISKAVQIVENRRPFMSAVNRAGLPATGNVIEFPAFAGYTGTVAEQAAEGDDLGLIKVTVTPGSANVKTYGAYSNLSRQSIERSDVNYLSLTLQAQLIAYAAATSGAVAGAVATAKAGPAARTILTANLGKAGAWTDLALDASMIVSPSGLSPQVMVVSLADFRKLAGITDTTGRPVFSLTGASDNTWGSVSLSGVKAMIGGFMPVIPIAEMVEGTAYLYDPKAITWYESAGAPVKLTQETIMNLSSQFAVYGYGAAAVNDTDAIIKVALGGV